jgi:hypothetical protein
MRNDSEDDDAPAGDDAGDGGSTIVEDNGELPPSLPLPPPVDADEADSVDDELLRLQPLPLPPLAPRTSAGSAKMRVSGLELM